MKLINQSAEILHQAPGLDGVYKHVELAGRTCYKSLDKITETSAKDFVDRMIKSHHDAMLEHGTVYLWNPVDDGNFIVTRAKYSANKYSKVRADGQAITANLRTLIEHGWLDDLKYLCEPTEYHEKRITFKLVTSIGITRELNRHRLNSIAEQSTRYCNYSKDKFNKEIMFIEPNWEIDEINKARYMSYLSGVEHYYMTLINNGWQPQQAREILPLCTATEIIHTAFESDWKHFFDLRYFEITGKVHPNMKDLSTKMFEELNKNNIKLWNTEVMQQYL